MVDAERRVGRGADACRPLAVEHPQRVVDPAVPVLVTEVARSGRQVGGERVPVRGATHGVAERVEGKVHPAQPDGGVEVGGEADDLDVEVGVVGAERLDTELVVLAVATGLGSLVTEVRRRVPDLPGRGRPVLDEGPDHAGGPLGSQHEVAAALVLEVVHLLAHHVGAGADLLEDTDVFEHRTLHQAVAGPRRDPGEGGDQRHPAR